METESAEGEGPPKDFSALIQVDYLPLALDDTLRTILHRHDDDAYRGEYIRRLHGCNMK